MDNKLGFGLMRLPLTDKNNNGSIDLELLKQMVDAFLERGFTYFDTAWMYCDGMSEHAVKTVLTDRHPRNTFTVTSKLPAHPLKTPEDRDKVFFEQLRKTGLEYFDYYLLHAVGPHNIETFRELDCFRWLMNKKEAGLAKKVGFSFHGSPEMLDELLTQHPQLDLVQLQINYLDWENEKVQSRACHEIAVRHNKSILIMEPVKGGTLVNVPETVQTMFRNADPDLSVPSWAIRFAASLPNVFMVLSGMSDLEQVLDNTSYMQNFKPLTAEEMKMMHLAGDIIRGSVQIPCTGCAYCTVNCPQNIPIPQYFASFNRKEAGEIASLAERFGKASDCVECGQCEAMCPQLLPIRKWLKTIADDYNV